MWFFEHSPSSFKSVSSHNEPIEAVKIIKMKRILIVAVASLLAASRASAADLPVRTGPAPAYYPIATVYDWGGGYIGINGGYAFGQSNWYDALNPSGTGSSGNFNINGGLVGVTAGVSGQFGSFVLSVEGDFDWQGIQGTSNSAFCTSIITSGAIGAGLSCKTASNWVGTLRARFGYAWGRVLLYGTAGGAGANVETSLNGLPVQNNAEFGWTAGGGLEWAFADNWTAKVEYLFIDLTGNVPCNHGYSCGFDTATTNANINVKFNENIVRAGLNFKFGH
jgi:outer membrane immunogenic protein